MKKSALDNDDLLIDNGGSALSHSVVAQTVVAQTAPGLSPSEAPPDSPPPPPPPQDGDVSFGYIHTNSGLFTSADGVLFVKDELGFYHDTVNANLPDFVTGGHGHMLFGAGNPTTGYDLQGNAAPATGDTGLLVFDKIIFRGGADIAPTADVNGVADFTVQHGGQVGNTTYAAWNFNFGIAAEPWQNLSDFAIRMKVAVDGHVFLDLDYNASAHAWDLHGTTTHVISDGGELLNKVDENSENIKFFKAAIDAAEPTITGHEYDAGHTYTVQIVGSQSGLAGVNSVMRTAQPQTRATIGRRQGLTNVAALSEGRRRGRKSG